MVPVKSILLDKFLRKYLFFFLKNTSYIKYPAVDPFLWIGSNVSFEPGHYKISF